MFLCESIIVLQCNHSKSKIMFYLYDIKTDFGKKEVKQAHLNLPSGELKTMGMFTQIPHSMFSWSTEST